MDELEQPAAARTRRRRVELGRGFAALLAHLARGVDDRVRHWRRIIRAYATTVACAPASSICAMRAVARMPSAAYAAIIASSTACADASPSVSANAEGPLFAIEQPS